MLLIPHIGLAGTQHNNTHKIHRKKSNSFLTARNIYGVDNKHLYTDTVCFSAKKQSTTPSIKQIVSSAKQRTSYPSCFSDSDIEEICAKVTPKNQIFLKEILSLNNKKLSAKSIITILNYLNQKDTNVDEFKEKLTTYKDFKNVVSNYGFKQSPLAAHFDKISQQGIIDLLTSDVLLREPKHNFNTLPEAYNNVVKVFESFWEKTKPSANAKPDEFAIGEFMSKNFASMLVLGMVFDRSVFNELVFNRGKYINTVYMPRLRALNQQDLEFLRKIQTDAVTEKENKSGDLAVYEISLDDKIATLNHLYANREIINNGYEGINFNNYVKPVNIMNTSGNFKIDFQHLKIDLMEKVLRRIGVDKNVVDKYMKSFIQTYEFEHDLMHFRNKFWDINYVHLINAPQNSLIRDIILAATEGRFKEMLFGEGPIAETNRKNREAFENAGINYENWLEPTIAPIKQKFITKNGAKEKTFFVKNWNRNPQESLFDGNYTTCCTGIDKDQGASFPIFLTNTCTTTLEVRTEKNKVIAMSRIFMAKINGKLSMVVENIEVNNKMAKHYLYNDETKYKFREMIFDYVRNFAKDINKTDKEIPIYFSSKYYKVKDIERGLRPGKRYENVELIGEFPDKIYINAYGGRFDKAKLHYADDGDEFALHLSDITKKTKPAYKKTTDEVESDSNYNYDDKESNWT